MFPELFELHGESIDLVSVIQDATGPVKELVEICEAHPWELYWTGDGVAIRETDKEAAQQHTAAMQRSVEIVLEHQEELETWLANLLK